MTHSAESALPTIATIMKMQLAKIGVEVTVEVLDRPIFLRRLTRDRDWDQTLLNTGAAIDPHTIDTPWCRACLRRGLLMDITLSEEVYRRLEEVKEWLESRLERDVTFDEVLVEILNDFALVEHLEDLGSG